jgi:hypothetical protein
VALEALRDDWTQRKLTMDALWHYATVDRVANVMRPYLESVTDEPQPGRFHPRPPEAARRCHETGLQPDATHYRLKRLLYRLSPSPHAAK